jgi:hypothetical protein
MARIKIDDLPVATDVNRQELKGIFGGSSTAVDFSGLSLRSRTDDIDSFMAEQSGGGDTFPWEFNVTP